MDPNVARFVLGTHLQGSSKSRRRGARRAWGMGMLLLLAAVTGVAWQQDWLGSASALAAHLPTLRAPADAEASEVSLLPPPPPSSAPAITTGASPAVPRVALLPAPSGSDSGRTGGPSAMIAPPHRAVSAEAGAAGDGPQPEAAEKAASALRAIDEMIRKQDLDSARERLQTFTEEDKRPDMFVADAYYRLGLIARIQKREEDAQGYWDRAYRSFPDAPGGRLAALALGDTRFVSACGSAPRYDEWEEVRDLYSAAIGMDGAPFLTDATARERVIANLGRLNERLVFSPAPTTGAIFHEVQGGDALYTIARKHKVHFDSIARINGIDANHLRKGQRLKILKAECTVVVDKRALTLTWYLDGKWVKQYPCCVGPAEKTPAGTYTITRKDEKPAWRNPQDGKLYDYGDPKNILGTRWLAIEGNGTDGLGIHGTTLPESIPGRTSNGCVRLVNANVEELYGFALIGSQVIIRE